MVRTTACQHGRGAYYTNYLYSDKKADIHSSRSSGRCLLGWTDFDRGSDGADQASVSSPARFADDSDFDYQRNLPGIDYPWINAPSQTKDSSQSELMAKKSQWVQIGKRKIELSNLDKVLFPEDNVLKA